MATYINLNEGKTHLRVDFDDDDSYIEGLINMVEEFVLDDIQGEAYITSDGTEATVGTTELAGTGTTFTNY